MSSDFRVSDADVRSFPVKGQAGEATTFIPWWLAEIAYKGYVKRYGDRQQLERLGERGGFSRAELVELISEGAD